MNEREKKADRFMFKAVEIELIFSPQCCECIHNINKFSCRKFKTKPVEYFTNEIDCPHFELRAEFRL